MTTSMEWTRYAVVHWTVDVASEAGLVRCGGRTRAFASLADAVLFASEFSYAQRQEARITCGGRSYLHSEIDELAQQSDFPHNVQRSAA
jgi:hypothetical protein